jgi:hypothetical protein
VEDFHAFAKEHNGEGHLSFLWHELQSLKPLPTGPKYNAFKELLTQKRFKDIWGNDANTRLEWKAHLFTVLDARTGERFHVCKNHQQPSAWDASSNFVSSKPVDSSYKVQNWKQRNLYYSDIGKFRADQRMRKGLAQSAANTKKVAKPPAIHKKAFKGKTLLKFQLEEYERRAETRKISAMSGEGLGPIPKSEWGGALAKIGERGPGETPNDVFGPWKLQLISPHLDSRRIRVSLLHAKKMLRYPVRDGYLTIAPREMKVSADTSFCGGYWHWNAGNSNPQAECDKAKAFWSKYDPKPRLICTKLPFTWTPRFMGNVLPPNHSEHSHGCPRHVGKADACTCETKHKGCPKFHLYIHGFPETVERYSSSGGLKEVGMPDSVLKVVGFATTFFDGETIELLQFRTHDGKGGWVRSDGWTRMNCDEITSPEASRPDVIPNDSARIMPIDIGDGKYKFVALGPNYGDVIESRSEYTVESMLEQAAEAQFLWRKDHSDEHEVEVARTTKIKTHFTDGKEHILLNMPGSPYHLQRITSTELNGYTTTNVQQMIRTMEDPNRFFPVRISFDPESWATFGDLLENIRRFESYKFGPHRLKKIMVAKRPDLGEASETWHEKKSTFKGAIEALWPSRFSKSSNNSDDVFGANETTENAMDAYVRQQQAQDEEITRKLKSKELLNEWIKLTYGLEAPTEEKELTTYRDVWEQHLKVEQAEEAKKREHEMEAAFAVLGAKISSTGMVYESSIDELLVGEVVHVMTPNGNRAGRTDANEIIARIPPFVKIEFWVEPNNMNLRKAAVHRQVILMEGNPLLLAIETDGITEDLRGVLGKGVLRPEDRLMAFYEKMSHSNQIITVVAGERSDADGMQEFNFTAKVVRTMTTLIWQVLWTSKTTDQKRSRSGTLTRR